MTQRRLHLLTQQEAVCLGTAMLAAAAAGEYRNLTEAAGELVKETIVVEPEADIVASYRDQQQRYCLLRSAMVA
jgi:sugar (pentulose or hexulose) kinase